MPRTMRRPKTFILTAAAATLALAGCSGDKQPGNTVEIRDMEVTDGTVNDSMTDLDAVKADGVGNVNNAGSVSRATEARPAENGNSGDTETVASE